VHSTGQQSVLFKQACHMITRVALPLLAILLFLPLLVIALPVLFVMVWIEEARRLRALRPVYGNGSQRTGCRG
jgi:hypothetical protein